MNNRTQSSPPAPLLKERGARTVMPSLSRHLPANATPLTGAGAEVGRFLASLGMTGGSCLRHFDRSERSERSGEICRKTK
jgi:hypothetical protein